MTPLLANSTGIAGGALDELETAGFSSSWPCPAGALASGRVQGLAAPFGLKESG